MAGAQTPIILRGDHGKRQGTVARTILEPYKYATAYTTQQQFIAQIICNLQPEQRYY
jgi:hypothetical protein